MVIKIKGAFFLIQLSILVSCILVLSACSFSISQLEEQTVFPVYFDPRYFFQIDSPNPKENFPFEAGSLVELEGVMVYHGTADWIETEILSQTQWSASIYPTGEILNADTLKVQLQGVTDPETIFEIDWQIDNDTRLFIVSDQPVPAELFQLPENGDAVQICMQLEIAQTGSTPTDQQQAPIILMPAGEKIGDLVLSAVQKCDS